MRKPYDVIIVGAGASGLACGASIYLSLAKSPNVLIVDVNKKPGRKLLATGNGRCNLSNRNISPQHYFGDIALCGDLLSAKAQAEVISFFDKLSLVTVNDDEGRVYPNSKQAQSVLSVLMSYIDSRHTDFLYETEITDISFADNLYVLKSETAEICRAKSVVLAVGGKASPKLSSGKNGYALAEKLGHSCTPLYPVLTQLKTNDKLLSGLSGVRCAASISLTADGRTIATERGELQITDKAISGICVFNLSIFAGEYFAHGSVMGKKAGRLSVKLDFLPDMEFTAVLKYINNKKMLQPDTKVINLLDGILNLKLSYQILKKLGINTDISLNKLKSDEIVKLCKQIKSTELVITGTNSWDDAQVTAGGVPLSEINPYTLESKKSKNLYLCGELLNIHGACGGFNLNFAWITGISAGRSIADKINKNDKNK